MSLSCVNARRKFWYHGLAYPGQCWNIRLLARCHWHPSSGAAVPPFCSALWLIYRHPMFLLFFLMCPAVLFTAPCPMDILMLWVTVVHPIVPDFGVVPGLCHFDFLRALLWFHRHSGPRWCCRWFVPLPPSLDRAPLPIPDLSRPGPVRVSFLKPDCCLLHVGSSRICPR